MLMKSRDFEKNHHPSANLCLTVMQFFSTGCRYVFCAEIRCKKRAFLHKMKRNYVIMMEYTV